MSMNRRAAAGSGLPALCLALLALLTGPSTLAAPDRWTEEVNALTAGDVTNPPPAGGTVFTGSSSIGLWKTLANDFPGIGAINRGFGGSQIEDCLFYLDRLVLAYRPGLVVLYAGENDINSGKSPEVVAADFKAFRARLHAALPDARLIYLSIKESPARAHLAAKFRAANALIAADCATDSRCIFVDVNTAMLDAGGSTKPELFMRDQIHLNGDGYAIWKRVLTPYLKQ